MPEVFRLTVASLRLASLCFSFFAPLCFASFRFASLCFSSLRCGSFFASLRFALFRFFFRFASLRFVFSSLRFASFRFALLYLVCFAAHLYDKMYVGGLSGLIPQVRQDSVSV